MTGTWCTAHGLLGTRRQAHIRERVSHTKVFAAGKSKGQFRHSAFPARGASIVYFTISMVCTRQRASDAAFGTG